MPLGSGSVEIAARAREARNEGRCVYCHAPAGEAPVVCPGCGTLVHAECLEALKKCPTLGCGRTIGELRRRRASRVFARLLQLGVLSLCLGLLGATAYGLWASGVLDPYLPASSFSWGSEFGVPAHVTVIEPPPADAVRPPSAPGAANAKPSDEPTLEETVAPEFDGWAGFRVGASVTMREVVTSTASKFRFEKEVRTVLVQQTGDRVTLEETTREVERPWAVETKRRVVRVRRDAAPAPWLAEVPGEVVLEVGVRRIPCRHSALASPIDDFRLETWSCRAIPGGLCKRVQRMGHRVEETTLLAYERP